MKGFRITSRGVLTISAWSIFLVSALVPFLTVPYYSIIPEQAYAVTYLAYKTTITHIGLVQYGKSETWFFNDYWFAQERPNSPPSPSDLGVSWVLVAMFLTQILTLGFGFTALFRHGRKTQFLPIIPCLSVTSLMVYVWVQAQSHAYGLAKYELGYWLTYPSAILFLYAFILSLLTKQFGGPNAH